MTPKLFCKVIHHFIYTFYKLKTIRYNNVQNKQQNFRKLKKNDIQNFNFHPADLQIVLALESEGISAISCNGAGVRNSGNCSLASCRRQLQLQLHFLGTRTHSYSYTHRYRCIHVRYFPSCPLRSVPMHARDAVFASSHTHGKPRLLVAIFFVTIFFFVQHREINSKLQNVSQIVSRSL